MTAVLFAFLLSIQTPQQAPRQPIPFSHRQHAGTLKLPCKMCHQPAPDSGEAMTLPEASRCMECHSAIKTESPSIRKLAAMAKQGTDIDWAPVYELPSYVKFAHQPHLDSGAACATCHGKVEERDQLYREVDLNMGTCMDCHRAKRATIACTACHEKR